MVRNDIKKLFGSSVRVWRNRLGVSQEKLAERAGLHRTYVCDIERGARNVSLESIEKLAGALEISTASLFGSADANETPLSSQTLLDILFVEDDPDDMELTLRALDAAHLVNRIHVARDGAEALDFLFCRGEFANRMPDRHPQMILLDLYLPKVSGLEVLRRVKADPATRSIPVIVLTASKQDADITTSKQLGADAYIVKPVGFENLSEAASQLSFQWALVKAERTTST